MKNVSLDVKEGEKLYKFIIQVNGSISNEAPFHRILTKQTVDGRIEAVVVYEYPDRKNHAYFECGSSEQFESSIDTLIEQLSKAYEHIFGIPSEYEVIDFSNCETIEEQLSIIQERPDLFNSWDYKKDGTRRPTRMDNKFLLDNDVPKNKY